MNTSRLLLSLCLCLLSASANASEPSVTVDFLPSPGTWEREFRMIALDNIDGNPGPTTSVRTVRKQEVKKDGEGWTITSTPSDVQIDGLKSPLDRAIQKILLGQTFTYKLDNKGQLIEVLGFDDLPEQVKKNIPAEARDAVSQVINADTQRWRLANQWATENAWLYGKSVNPGETYTLDKTLTPPDGPAMDFTQKSIPTLGKDSDSLKVTFNNVATPTKDADLRQLTALNVTEKGERRFDIASGLPLEEASIRQVEVTIRSEAGLISQVREETRHIVYRKIEE